MYKGWNGQNGCLGVSSTTQAVPRRPRVSLTTADPVYESPGTRRYYPEAKRKGEKDNGEGEAARVLGEDDGGGAEAAERIESQGGEVIGDRLSHSDVQLAE